MGGSCLLFFSLFNNRLKTSLVLVLTSSKKIIDTSIALAKMHLIVERKTIPLKLQEKINRCTLNVFDSH